VWCASAHEQAGDGKPLRCMCLIQKMQPSNRRITPPHACVSRVAHRALSIRICNMPHPTPLHPIHRPLPLLSPAPCGACRREESLTSSILKRQLLHWQEGAARGSDADPWGAAADSGLQEVLATVAPLLQGQVGGTLVTLGHTELVLQISGSTVALMHSWYWLH
jgi:hypothetical protein